MTNKKTTSECTDYRDLIKGISFRVCQEHYDERLNRGIVSTDEIVPKNECSLSKCNKLYDTKNNK